MPGRIGRQPQSGPFDRLPIRQLTDFPPAEAELIEPAGVRRAERILMPSHMVDMGVRDKRPRLPPAKVHRQLGLRELQSTIKMKHGRPSSRNPPCAGIVANAGGKVQGNIGGPWSADAYNGPVMCSSLYKTLEQARSDQSAALVMEGDSGGQIYLTCPVARIGCEPEALENLLIELDSFAWGDGETFFIKHLPIGSHVAGGMGGGAVIDGVWLHEDFENLHLRPAVEQIVFGIRPWVAVPSPFDQLRRLGRAVPLVAGPAAEPNSALLCAAAAGDAAILRDLLATSDVNAVDVEGWSALLWAAAMGHLQTVDALLDAAANPNRCNSHGQTPLMWACWEGHRDVVVKLLHARAQVNVATTVDRTIPECWRAMPAGRGAVLHGGQTALSWAVQNGDLNITRALLEAGAIIDLGDVRRSTPLMRAKTAEMARLLLRAGAQVNLADNDGRSALHFAIAAGRLDVVQELLTAGADVVFHFRMKEALTEAIAGGHWSIVALFLDRGLDVNATMPFRANLLGTAVRRGQVELAQALMQRGARPLNTIDMLGRTPLLDALHERLDLSLVQALLDAGADPNLSAPHNGLTALMIAALHYDLAAVETLLAAGANPHALDNAKNTALAYAMRPANPHVGGQQDQVIDRLRAVGTRLH